MTNRKLSSSRTHNEPFGSMLSTCSTECGEVLVTLRIGTLREFVLVEERGAASEISNMFTSETDVDDRSAGGSIDAFIATEMA